MTTIAFLGLGAMGSRMVGHLLDRDFSVVVWNRSSATAQSFVNRGARIADTPLDAAKGADFVISMLRDDQASRDVWLNSRHGALLGMQSGSIAIECSTLSLPWIYELGSYFQQRNVALVDAPVVGSRPQADAAELVFLAGADSAVVNKIQPILGLMGSKVTGFGALGAGMAVKLAVNALFGVQQAAIAELLGLLHANKVDVDSASEAIAAMPVCSPAIRLAMQAMLAGQFAPQFPIELVAKDFECILRSLQEADTALPISKAAGGVFSLAAAEGFGNNNINAVINRYVSSLAS